MKRLALFAVALASLAGCQGDQYPTDSPDLKRGSLPENAAPQAQINKLINALFDQPEKRQVHQLFAQEKRRMARGEVDLAQQIAGEIAQVATVALGVGHVNDPDEETAAEGVHRLIDLVFAFSGFELPDGVDPELLEEISQSSDFVVAVVPPTGATVLTENEDGDSFAGVDIEDEDIDETIVVTIRKIDQVAEGKDPCLPTGLIQSKGCWEYNRFPVGNFANEVDIELCVDVGDLDIPVGDLVTLHKFSEATGVVELAIGAGGIGVGCINFQAATEAAPGGFFETIGERLAALLAPRPLMAGAVAERPKKLSGATSSFTDMGGAVAVDVTKDGATDNQTATVDTPVASPPAVTVTDEATSNPVAGVEITFSVATGSGSITGAVATTNASGVATVGSWTLGPLPGVNTLTATTGAEGDEVTFTATGVLLPDLFVQTLTHSPASPTEFDQITFTAVVKNIGTGAAGPSTLEFRIGGETPGAPTTQFAVPALGAGISHQVQRVMTLIPQGYINTAVADVNDDVAESDETNNQKQDSYVVSAVTGAAINFDVDPTGAAVAAGTAVTNLYAAQGVTFQHAGTGTTCGTTVYANGNLGTSPAGTATKTPPNVVSLCPAGIASDISENTFGSIAAGFSKVATQVCIDVFPVTSPGHFAVIRAFSMGGALLGSATSTPDVSEALCISGTGIKSVTFSGSGTNFARFDNLNMTY